VRVVMIIEPLNPSWVAARPIGGGVCVVNGGRQCSKKGCMFSGTLNLFPV